MTVEQNRLPQIQGKIGLLVRRVEIKIVEREVRSDADPFEIHHMRLLYLGLWLPIRMEWPLTPLGTIGCW